MVGHGRVGSGCHDGVERRSFGAQVSHGGLEPIGQGALGDAGLDPCRRPRHHLVGNAHGFAQNRRLAGILGHSLLLHDPVHGNQARRRRQLAEPRLELLKLGVGDVLGLEADAGRTGGRHRIRQSLERLGHLHHVEVRRLLARLHCVAKVRHEHPPLRPNEQNAGASRESAEIPTVRRAVNEKDVNAQIVELGRHARRSVATRRLRAAHGRARYWAMLRSCSSRVMENACDPSPLATKKM